MVETSTDFCASDKNFCLLNNQFVYDKSQKQVVYAFKYAEPRVLNNKDLTPNQCLKSWYVFNFPELIEIWTEKNEKDNCYFTYIIKNNYDGNRFCLADSMVIGRKNIDCLTRIDDIILIHGCWSSSYNTIQFLGLDYYYISPEYKNKDIGIYRINLKKLTSTKIDGMWLQYVDGLRAYDPSEKTYSNLIIKDRFCIVFDRNHYMIYDLVRDEEVESFDTCSIVQNSDLYVRNEVLYHDGGFIVGNEAVSELYILE